MEHNIAVMVYKRGGMMIGNKTKADLLSSSTCERNTISLLPVVEQGGGIVARVVLHKGCTEHLAGLSNEN